MNGCTALSSIPYPVHVLGNNLHTDGLVSTCQPLGLLSRIPHTCTCWRPPFHQAHSVSLPALHLSVGSVWPFLRQRPHSLCLQATVEDVQDTTTTTTLVDHTILAIICTTSLTLDCTNTAREE